MYFLMNKNNVAATFEKKPATAFSDEVLFTEVERIGKLPLGFEDINTWIDSRKSSKHNAHLQKLMRQMGCDDNESFIKRFHIFADAIDNIELGSNVFKNECVSSDTVQYTPLSTATIIVSNLEV